MVAVEEIPEVEHVPRKEGPAAAAQGASPSKAPAPALSASAKHEAAFERADALRLQGNQQMGKGNFADASKCYQDGLVAIVVVGDPDVERANEARLALHLNASLAELRRSNLGAAVDHATGALAMDPKSAKAFYRRGLARQRLSEHVGHETNVSAALLDFEKAVELEPNNTEARNQMKALRDSMRSGKKELNKGQKSQFKGMFDKGKQLYEDVAPGEQQPAIRDDGSDCKTLAMSVEHLKFHYDKADQILIDLNLELREGWCLGLCGNNATGKSTLARIMTGKLRPKQGEVKHHSGDDGSKADGQASSASSASSAGYKRTVSVVGAVLVGGVAIAVHMLVEEADAKTPWIDRLQWWHWLVLVCCVGVCLMAVFPSWCRRGSAAGAVGGGSSARPRKRSVLHVSSETSDKETISKNMTIEAVISEKMPKRLSKEEKRDFVVAMLRAGGFQMYNQETGEEVGSPEEYVRDGLLFSNLSGGQQHLIYVLRCFAGRPEVLLCDELLGGLDSYRQPRVLHMLNRLKREANTAVLYITCELHQMRMICDSFAYLSGGRIVEMGPTMDVFDDPKHPKTKDYVGTYKSLPGGSRIGGKLAEAYVGIQNDEALRAPWIPPRS